MKNKEKYDLRNFNISIINGAITIRKNEFIKDFDGYRAFACWLEEENKEPVKLTRAEKTILENIYSDWKWIARGKYGSLYLFQSKPFKQVRYWEEPLGDKGYGITVFGHLFNFIKWEDEKPYNITELLKKL